MLTALPLQKFHQDSAGHRLENEEKQKAKILRETQLGKFLTDKFISAENFNPAVNFHKIGNFQPKISYQYFSKMILQQEEICLTN